MPHRLSRPVCFLRRSALCGLIAAAGLTGCNVSYETYPSDGAPRLQNANIGAIRPASAAAVRAVASQGPRGSDGSFAVNLPEGMSTRSRLEVTDLIGTDAEPVSRANYRAVPVYHVGRVWVRGADATVDVLVPRDAGVDPTQQDRHDYDGYTVYLKGGLKPWRGDRFRRWLPGPLAVPALAFGPETDDAAAPMNEPMDFSDDGAPPRPAERDLRGTRTPTPAEFEAQGRDAYEAERERALRENFRPAPAPAPQSPPPQYQPQWAPSPVAPAQQEPQPSFQTQPQFEPPADPALQAPATGGNPWIEENIDRVRPSQETWRAIEQAGADTQPSGAQPSNAQPISPPPNQQPAQQPAAQPAPANTLPPPPAPSSNQSNLPPRYVPGEG